uniref:Uncharacterized protein n=1 Tax=Rhizophora mucronata TaxID=61149 RepID=A0A2P2N535_RHIMU
MKYLLQIIIILIIIIINMIQAHNLEFLTRLKEH